MSPSSTELLDFIERLKANGLVIVDDPNSVHSVAKAKHYIRRIGYYRFQQYCEPFTRKLNKNPTEIVCGLDDVMRLQKFDRHLRLLSLDALERIEVTIKSYLNDHLVTMHGKDWFLNKSFNGACYTKGEGDEDRVETKEGEREATRQQSGHAITLPNVLSKPE